MPSKKRPSDGDSEPASEPAAKRRMSPQSSAQQETASAQGAKVPESDKQTSSSWVPPKTKRSAKERSIGYVGAIVPPVLRKPMSGKEERVLRNGPNGPLVYDSLGYELNYAAVRAAMMGHRRRRLSTRNLQARMDSSKRISQRKAEIMGQQPDQASVITRAAWADRVARDLDIPFHTVGLPDFEEWHRRGFRLEPGEIPEQLPKDECDRLHTLMTGSALREEYHGDI